MNVTIKFMSSLMTYSPQGADAAGFELDLEQSVTPHQIVERYRIPLDQVRVMMVNGVFLPPEKRDNALQDGDVLSVWPVIQGG